MLPSDLYVQLVFFLSGFMPSAGTLKKVLVAKIEKLTQTAKAPATTGMLKRKADDISPDAVAAPAPQAASAPVAAAMPAETANLSAAITTKIDTPAAGRFYSPLVLNIANQEGVSMQELEALPGTGSEGRVTKKDILQYVADKKAGKIAAPAPAAPAPMAAAAPAPAPAP